MIGKFEQDYFDVLRAIEQAIHSQYVRNQSLVDYQIDKVLNALERSYRAEQRLRPAPALKLTADEINVHDEVRKACELYLGRDPDIHFAERTLSPDEIIACLKRIQRSVHLMRDKGRQGYLHFISGFFTD